MRIQSKVMNKAHEMKMYFNGLSWSEILRRAWEFVKAHVEVVIEKVGLVEIQNLIVGCGMTRITGFKDVFNFSALMQVADEKGHFVADILNRALRGGSVSEKQAWCVAYFAQSNGYTD